MVDIQRLNSNIEARKRELAEARVVSKQWASRLIENYGKLSEVFKDKLPPFPYTTPESVFPTLFSDNYDYAQYKKEWEAASDFQQAMLRVLSEYYETSGKALLS